KIDDAGPWLRKQRRGCAGDGSHCSRAYVGVGTAEARVVKRVRHDHIEPHAHPVPEAEVFLQPEVEIAERRAAQNIEAGGAEPAHIGGITAHRVGCRAAGNSECGGVEPTRQSTLAGWEIPVADSVRIS